MAALPGFKGHQAAPAGPAGEEKESEVEKYLKTIDPMALSPLDALSTLIELKKLVK